VDARASRRPAGLGHRCLERNGDVRWPLAATFSRRHGSPLTPGGTAPGSFNKFPDVLQATSRQPQDGPAAKFDLGLGPSSADVTLKKQWTAIRVDLGTRAATFGKAHATCTGVRRARETGRF